MLGRKPGTDGTDPNFSAAKLGERPVCTRFPAQKGKVA